MKVQLRNQTIRIIFNKHIWPSGIITLATIKHDNKTLAVGTAKQNPKDKYNKFFGKKLALTRALSELNFTKEERTIIYQEFFNMMKTCKDFNLVM